MPTIKEISGPYRFFFYSFDCAVQILAEPCCIDQEQGVCAERTQYDKGKDYKQQRQNNGGMA